MILISSRDQSQKFMKIGAGSEKTVRLRNTAKLQVLNILAYD
jgi:hypothetical protein